MACIRKRGKRRWVVDYRDAWGRRRWVSRRTREAAKTVLAEVLRAAHQPSRPVVDPDIRLDAYADRWLGLVPATVKPRTVETYRRVVTLHLVPALGRFKLAALHRSRIKTLLVEQLGSRSRGTVRLTLAVLRTLLSAAVDDGVLLANPATRLGRALKLASPAAPDTEEMKAMTRPQVAAFLATAGRVVPRYAPLFLLFARTGMRLGEALALQWPDLDFQARTLRVARALSAGRVETPKSGRGRTVDMSAQLSRALLRLAHQRKAETLRRGWPELPPWLFVTTAGTVLDPSRTLKAFKRTLRKAGLPLHFSPHCLRHTYASSLLSDGVSPAYVQRQLGHSSIKLTVDLYGRWLPMENKGAVDRLDDVETGSKVESGSKTVAAAGGRPPNP